jgi:hypothetical protein
MRIVSCSLGVSLLAGLAPATGQTVQFPYSAAYSLRDLGTATGVPTPIAGVAFKHNNPNVLLVAGYSGSYLGGMFALTVTRDTQGHITGFSGSAERLADAAYVDGGIGYGPNQVLFFGRYPEVTLGQIKTGSAITDKVVDLGQWGIPFSTSSVNFVPAGFPGAGRCKVATYPAGQWWDLTIGPDGNGTFNVTGASQNFAAQISRGPEGFAYVPLNSPLFTQPSMLVTEWSSASIGAYQIDANGDPKPLTRSPFIINLPSIEGATFDPVSKDFIFCAYTNGSIYAVRGFTGPAPTACYVNCDQSTVPPILSANDFSCFLNLFAAGSPGANCDASTALPVLNANDFQCFLNNYAAGCS